MGTGNRSVPDRPISLGNAFGIGFAWGVGRRIVAMRRTCETFTAVSSVALSMAGMRAAIGTTALVNTHGPNGILRPNRITAWDDSLALPNVLDAPGGRRGTTAMTGMRLAADLGEYKALALIDDETGCTTVLCTHISVLSSH